jgi:hypothetical protein
MLIVDAYNVLHVTGVLPPEIAGVDVRGLAQLILTSRWGQSPVRLICDGTPPAKGVGVRYSDGGGRLRIVYAGGGHDADSRIEALIDESSSPRRLTIVSSDRRLRSAARRRRARWLSSEAFLQSLTDDWRRSASHRPPAESTSSGGPLSDSETDQWLEEFGVDPLPPQTQAPEETKREDPPAVDPRLIEEIQSEWPDEVDPDDLDMSKWIPPEDTQPGSSP